MKYQTFYDLMDTYCDDSIELQQTNITNADRVMALTMDKLGPRAVSEPAKQQKLRRVRKGLRIGLIAAMFALALSVTAFAVYQARIADYIIPAPTPTTETASGEAPSNEAATTEVTQTPEITSEPVRANISLVGYQGTPEYEAYVEWTTWLDENPADFSALGVDDTWFEVPENYAYLYSASTQEQADKLDEIMEKHGLTLHKMLVGFDLGEVQQLYDILGMEPVVPAAYTDKLGGYLYDNGAFKLESGILESDLTFSLFVNVKGSFSLIHSSTNPDYEEWSYTTASGQTVDLILDADGLGTVLYETDGAYVYARAAYDFFSDAPHMTREELEAFADSINFAVLSKRFDGKDYGDTAQKVAELNEKQKIKQAEETANWLAPFSSIEERNEYVFATLGDWRYPAAPEGFTYRWTNTDYYQGNAFHAWDTWDSGGIYGDELTSGYRYDTGEDNVYEFLFAGYTRYYTGESRTALANQEELDAYRDNLSGIDCQVGDYKALYISSNDFDPGNRLMWLDEDRGLIFSLRSECFGDNGELEARSQTELIALAEFWMESLDQ